MARTTRTLGTLVQSGVPILEALNIVRDTAGNMVFERAFTRIYDSIREGETIAQPLREARIVDDIVVNMIDVGEETGDLDTMLNKIADNYDEEVETLVESLVSLLEPIMIVVLGGIIGFIVIALFLPLISLDQQALGLIRDRQIPKRGRPAPGRPSRGGAPARSPPDPGRGDPLPDAGLGASPVESRRDFPRKPPTSRPGPNPFSFESHLSRSLRPMDRPHRPRPNRPASRWSSCWS